MKPLDFRLRVVLFVAGILLGTAIPSLGRSPAVSAAVAGESLESAVRRNVAAVLLERRGAVVKDPERDVLWVDAPKGALGLTDALRVQTFVALATPPGHLGRDLYRLEARVTPYGVVFDDRWIVDLTQSQLGDDAAIATSGSLVASAVFDEGRLTAVELRDLAGERPDRVETTDFSLVRRLGNWVTNLEQTGTRRGIDLDTYPVELPVKERPAAIGLRFEAAGETGGTGAAVSRRLAITSPDGKTLLAAVDLETRSASGALALSHREPESKMRYDFLNWLADRGRGLALQGLGPAWLGSGVELMKEVYFKANEVQADIEAVVAGPVEPPKVEAPEVVQEAKKRAKIQAERGERAWPPAPLEPMLTDRQQGEGLWEEIDAQSVTHLPNTPPPFYRTWIRPDEKYPTKRVWMVAWDPELVSLDARAGRVEPVPQTGNRGDGRIPRDPKLLPRVVGAFNGGFQTAHVWYGMMVDKKVLLPPREYGATAGAWADGRTAFGTWPVKAPIPDELQSYRQNLPPLIQDGVFNPYGRNTWGWHKDVAGAVDGKTIRTALCYTYDENVLFFFADFVNEHTLASALFHVGCRYAIHLDMNRGHSGMEMYRLLGKDEPPRKRDAMAEVEGFRFEGITMHPGDKHMEAPTRYLGTDYRDFFYLALRHVVPGADLEPLVAGQSSDGKWRTTGFAHNAEVPPRVAVTRLATASGGSIEVLQLDPRGLALSKGAEGDAKALVLSLPLSEAAGAAQLEAGGMTFSGQPLTDAPGTPVPHGAVVALSPEGFVFLALLVNASPADAAKALAGRIVDGGVWYPIAAGKAGRRAAYVYQSTPAGLIEQSLGEGEGIVVTAPTLDGPRVVASARARPPRIVRLFPEMRPKQKKTTPAH